MTLTNSTWHTSDFTNPASAKGLVSDVMGFTAFAASMLMGPGALILNPRLFSNPAQEIQSLTSLAAASPPAVIPAGELVMAIKERWQLNMTELAELMGVQRPTLYNWLKGKTSPDGKLQKHLQTLAAAAADWQDATAGANWDFLLDYTGPRADEVTIRETLGRTDVSPSEIRDLIHSRLQQYQEASVRSREVLGESLPIKGEPLPESTRKLNKRWTENAQRLHRTRNISL